jgi:hypothetical protein
MTIFVVIPQPNPNTSKLGSVIASSFKDSYYALEADKGWLISTRGTAQELSEKLQLTSGESGAAVVFETAAYFGRANPNIWSWIKSKLEAPASG